MFVQQSSPVVYSPHPCCHWLIYITWSWIRNSTPFYRPPGRWAGNQQYKQLSPFLFHFLNRKRPSDRNQITSAERVTPDGQWTAIDDWHRDSRTHTAHTHYPGRVHVEGSSQALISGSSVSTPTHRTESLDLLYRLLLRTTNLILKLRDLSSLFLLCVRQVCWALSKKPDTSPPVEVSPPVD